MRAALRRVAILIIALPIGLAISLCNADVYQYSIRILPFTVTPATAGGSDLGTSALPFGKIEYGTAAINVEGGQAAGAGYLGTATNQSMFLMSNGTFRWGVDSNGDLIQSSGGRNLVCSTTGTTLAVDSGTPASACKGTGTFNGTTAVRITTTCASTGSQPFIQPTSDPTGSTAAYCWVTNIVNNTSFDVDCDQANDGTFGWWILKEG